MTHLILQVHGLKELNAKERNHQIEKTFCKPDWLQKVFLYCFIHHVSAAGIVGYSFVLGPFDLALHRGALLGTIDVGVRTRHLRNAL